MWKYTYGLYYFHRYSIGCQRCSVELWGWPRPHEYTLWRRSTTGGSVCLWPQLHFNNTIPPAPDMGTQCIEPTALYITLLRNSRLCQLQTGLSLNALHSVAEDLTEAYNNSFQLHPWDQLLMADESASEFTAGWLCWKVWYLSIYCK